MHLPSRHRQTLVPQKIRNVFSRRAFHPQPTCKRVPQVMPAKILNSCLDYRVVEPVPPVLKLALLFSSTGTHALRRHPARAQPEGRLSQRRLRERGSLLRSSSAGCPISDLSSLPCPRSARTGCPCECHC